MSSSATLDGFVADGEGGFRGLGLEYRISRGGLASDGQRYLWTILTPGGAVLAAGIYGLDDAIRCATDHALTRGGS